MNYTAVIVAAGAGSRMGLGYNKVYYRMDGKTILEHTMQAFLNDTECTQVVVVTDPELFREEIGTDADSRITVTSGGATRQDSVQNGIRCAVNEIVMIHDGARPYISLHSLGLLKDIMETEQAACLMVPCKDTIKRVRDGYIAETYPRSELMAAQTPQVFRRELLQSCFDKAEAEGFIGTDDCSLVERFSDVRIRVVEGEYSNIKITTPEDIGK